MPHIDPVQLLNCLSVLLSPNGGIKSKDEVHRLASLMTKFSKKLVSKCIYIQILKCTETEILGLFMGSSGWRLVHTWLTESIVAKNWPLVKELLELLLLCPVDIERLKTNNCPKLVKELSKDGSHCAIRALASKLVEQWLKTVKGDKVIPVNISDISKIISDVEAETKQEEIFIPEILSDNEVEKNIEVTENSSDDVKVEKSEEIINTTADNICEKQETDKESETLPILKITLKNGKQIISQVHDETDAREKSQEKTEVKDSKHKSKSRDKTIDSSSSSSSSRSSNSKHSSKTKSSNDKHSHNRDSSSRHGKDRKKDKDRHSSSSSHSSKSKHNSSSSSSSSNSKKYSSSSRSKDDKSSQKHTEKDKDKALYEKDDKPHSPPSIHKLGKIPKLSDVKRERPSISIEVRKPDEPKPKTVKMFNSKFRKHGLEEEVKPPPSRAAILSKKPPPPLFPPTVPKRSSPIHNESPPEKKSKTVEVEKPGAIKLIPPKPKQGDGNPEQTLTVTSKDQHSLGYRYKSAMVLQESDMFMDALNASATNKKEPKKRKRRTSGSKDGNAPNDSSPPHTPTTPENKSVPPRFYQDTLDEEETKEKTSDKRIESDDNSETILNDKVVEEKMEVIEPHTLTINGLKGVLCYHKRKGPKKSIKWKPEPELEEIQYFELDETERVNVTKTFTDMKHLERINERDAFEKARNLTNDDIMEEKTLWRPLIVVDCEEQIQVEYGKSSKEKDIQAIRQKGTLQPLYFHKSMIPDSPFEPDLESHPYSESTIIPLDDVTGNVSDFRNMPWPEPKGNAPPAPTNNVNVPPMFPPNMPPFPNSFPPAQFPGMPGFQGPPMLPGDWQNNVSPLMVNGLPVPMGTSAMPPGSVPPGAMPPGLMVPPESMMMGPEMFGGPNPMFPIPPEGFNMPPNMFPAEFNMGVPQGPPGPDVFAGPGSFRGAMRGRGIGGQWRGKPNANYDGPQRGRGGRGGRKAVCIYFQRKGSCRQGDNCTFLHPGVNCPF